MQRRILLLDTQKVQYSHNTVAQHNYVIRKTKITLMLFSFNLGAALCSPPSQIRRFVIYEVQRKVCRVLQRSSPSASYEPPPPTTFLSNHLVFLPLFHFGLWHRRRKDNSPHALNQPAAGMRGRDPAATTEEALNSSFHRKEEKKVPWEEVKQKGRRSARSPNVGGC